MTDAYELVAMEYYDASLHPTCANLRQASDMALDLVADARSEADGTILEIGSGASALTEHAKFKAAHVIAVDLNPGMLARSECQLVLGDATAMPFRSDTFSFVYGSLADPYNTPAFYAETVRVLRSGGSLAFSVPDFNWVRANQRVDNLPSHTAAFTLQTGQRVLLPSIVHEYEEQESALRSAGFAEVRRYSIPVNAIDEADLSPRFRGAQKAGLSFDAVVTMYLCTK